MVRVTVCVLEMCLPRQVSVQVHSFESEVVRFSEALGVHRSTSRVREPDLRKVECDHGGDGRMSFDRSIASLNGLVKSLSVRPSKTRQYP